MATKPLVSTAWAMLATALRIAPTAQQQQYGWSTSNNLTTGVPEKPTLQHQNGWQYNVKQWLDYFEAKTDEMQPPLTGTVGKFLQSTGTTTQWADPFPSITGQAGKFLYTNGTAIGWASVDALPPQTGQSGKFLTTNGAASFWAAVDALPPQTGQNGKYLTTDGSTASWATIQSFPPQTGNAGKFLTTNGTVASWADTLPTQTGNSGKFLQTNGSVASWQTAPIAGVITLSATGGAIDMALYNVANALALTGASSFSFTNIQPGRAVTIFVKAASGSPALTWPSGMNWADGITLPNATTIAAAVTVVATGTTVASMYVSAIRSFVAV